MSYWQNRTTANAAQDEQKDKSDYVAELAEHLDVDRNALSTVLSDASLSVLKALVVELGPGGGEAQDGPSANARIPEEYTDGTIDGRRRDDVVDLDTARDRVQTLVANSAGTGSSTDSSGDKPIGKMTKAEVEDALEELEDTFLSEENLQQAAEAAVQAKERGEDPKEAASRALNGDSTPTSNDAGGAAEDPSDYPDGTIGIGAGTGSYEPTGNASTEQRDTGSDDLDDYSDGTIGGGL